MKSNDLIDDYCSRTADVVRCKSKKAASDSSPVLHATRPSVPKWMRRHILCEDDSEGCIYRERQKFDS